MNLPNLQQLLTYKNDRLISRYNLDYPAAALSAEEALSEFMKFIWICCKHKSEKKRNPEDNRLHFSCTIHPEMADIDNMWHTFLLFTKDYHEFCNQYLSGIFFHHEPLTGEDIPEGEWYEQELSLYLSFIYDHLGEETLIKWFNISS